MWLLACIAARLALVALATQINNRSRRRLAAAGSLAVGVGFLLVWGRRLRAFESTGAGNGVWWDALRPVHAALWLTAAAMLYSDGVRRREAWVTVLALDAALGITVFALYVQRCKGADGRRACPFSAIATRNNARKGLPSPCR